MATNNAVNVGLSGATGTGNFVGSTSPTITTPKIVTGLNDNNGNTWIAENSVSGAVNHITIQNNSTGNIPAIQVSGSDSQIGLNVFTKDSNINIVDATNTIAPSIKWYNSAGSNFTGLKCPSSSGSSLTFNLPSSDQEGFMISDGSTNLSLSGTYTDISGTISVVGVSLASTLFFQYLKIGKMVFYSYAIIGTSNATTFTVSGLPFTSTLTGLLLPIYTTNNGNAAVGMADFSGTGITFYSSAANSSWTASGTKTALGTCFIQTTT